MIAQGDYFQGEVNYTRGALRYINDTNTGNFGASMGSQEVYGVISDCVYGSTSTATGVATGATGCNLTTAWSVNAAYEHYWAPQWHQSLVGSYSAVNYGSQANAILCAAAGNGVGAGATAVATPGCNNNWSMYGVSSRLQWDVTKTFYLGVEVLYDHMNGATTSDGLLHGYALGAPSSPLTVTTGMNTWEGTVRMHKDFLP
jgi:hypothetical protein